PWQSIFLKHLVNPHPEQPAQPERQRQRRVVLPCLDRVHALPRHLQPVSQLCLRPALLRAQLAQPVLHRHLIFMHGNPALIARLVPAHTSADWPLRTKSSPLPMLPRTRISPDTAAPVLAIRTCAGTSQKNSQPSPPPHPTAGIAWQSRGRTRRAPHTDTTP